jgi:hypothetical protein
MASKTEFDAVLASIDTETTRIGARLEALLAQIAAGGMTAEEEAAVLAEGNRLATKLRAIGADPTTPVPEPEPAPPVEGEGEGGGTPDTQG